MLSIRRPSDLRMRPIHSPNADCAKGRRLESHLLEDDISVFSEFVQHTFVGVHDHDLTGSLPHCHVKMAVASVAETLLTVSGNQCFRLAPVSEVVGRV